jgi:hypothetical protein
MRRLLLATVFCLVGLGLTAQNFEIAGLEESYKGSVGEVIQAPLKIKNTFDKPITLVIKELKRRSAVLKKTSSVPTMSVVSSAPIATPSALSPVKRLKTFPLGWRQGLPKVSAL